MTSAAELQPRPFVPPNCEDDENQPLCPWYEEQHDHIKYYSDIGGMKAAQEDFITKVKELKNLSKKGRLVVVTGRERSGKSSLINWCAHWVKGELESRYGMKAKILDIQIAKGLDVEERLIRASKAVSDQVRDLVKLDESTDNKMWESRGDPIDVFSLLRRIHKRNLQSKTIFIGLLSSLETDTAEREIARYLEIVGPGMLFMVEYSADEPIEPQDDGPQPIRLGLRHLAPGEAFLLVKGWPKGPPDSSMATFLRPEVRQEELDMLDRYVQRSSRKLTTGQVLKILRRVHRSRANGTSSSPTLDYVAYSEILEAMFHRPNDEGGV